MPAMRVRAVEVGHLLRRVRPGPAVRGARDAAAVHQRNADRRHRGGRRRPAVASGVESRRQTLPTARPPPMVPALPRRRAPRPDDWHRGLDGRRAPAPGAPPGPTLRPVPGYRHSLRGRPSPQAPSAPPPRPGPSATGPITLPGSQTPLPKEKPRPKAEPAVVPKPDTTLSFSERYRGHPVQQPRHRALPAPAPRRDGSATMGPDPARQSRRGRLCWLPRWPAAGSSSSHRTRSSGRARARPAAPPCRRRPRPTPRPTPTINGLIADEVEIAACLLFARGCPAAG